MNKYCLGKRPARNLVRLKFGDFFSLPDLPKPPLMFGHTGLIRTWGMLSNDTLGDCVVAEGAHGTMLHTAEGGNPALYSTTNVIADYSAISGYVPSKPETDIGCDMKDAAAYRLKTGLLDASNVRHKIDAYVALEPGNVEQYTMAAWLFGGVGCGLELGQSAEDQFDAGVPWKLVRGESPQGGHDVLIAGKNSKGLLYCVTWGELQGMEDSFFANSDEALVYLDLSRLSTKKLSPEGYNETRLRSVLAEIGH